MNHDHSYCEHRLQQAQEELERVAENARVAMRLYQSSETKADVLRHTAKRAELREQLAIEKFDEAMMQLEAAKSVVEAARVIMQMRERTWTVPLDVLERALADFDARR